MASDPTLGEAERLFLEALRCGIAGAPVPWTEPPELSAQKVLAHLARGQLLQPLIVQALFPCPALADSPVLAAMEREARLVVQRQATRTAEFLLLLRQLEERGLHPVVLKGAVCRSLYPEPEQRPSTDEDLLIDPKELARWHRELLACGLRLLGSEEPEEEGYELTYVDPDRDLYLELHLRLFKPDSDVCGDFNRFFEGALSRRVSMRLYGQALETLCPTDHLLYILGHAYKHLLYGGVGVRQLCDICLFANRYAGEIDWTSFRRACEEMGILTLAAAVFRFGERRLGVPVPACFADLDPDEEPLLMDCLTGGLYGANDPDRSHSISLTLDAVAADKQGRRTRGLLRALFPTAASLEGRYPYLRKRPALLPAAWAQRLWHYARSRGKSPKQSIQIGRERIALLERYGLITHGKEEV